MKIHSCLIEAPEGKSRTEIGEVLPVKKQIVNLLLFMEHIIFHKDSALQL